MSQIDTLLAANRLYVAARANRGASRPGRRLAVVTCMDSRIDVFAALGLYGGEAHIIRNAGGRVTEDVLRSLAVSCNLLGVDTVVIMQHTECSLARHSDDELQELTGAEIDFLSIDDHASALGEDVDQLAATPYLEPVQVIAGLLFDVTTGAFSHIVDWRRPV